MSLIKVELEQQVVDFIRSLAPEPRQAIRRSLKNLENEAGLGSRFAVRRSPIWRLDLGGFEYDNDDDEND